MIFINKLKSNEKLYRFFTLFKKHIKETEIGDRSVVVAYYLLLSFFPLLIVVGNLLPYVNITPATVLPYLKEIIPQEIYSFLSPAIKSMLSNNSGGLLSISALAAIWSSSKGINSLQKALNRAYGVEDRGNFVISRVVSVGVIALLLLSIIAIALFFSVGQVALDTLQPLLGFPSKYMKTFLALRWPVTLFGLLFILSVFYLIIPNVRTRFRATVPGTLFATMVWILLAQGFGFYAKKFAKSVSGYQIIGSFIVLMLWLTFIAMAMILGGILNSTLDECRFGKKPEDTKEK